MKISSITDIVEGELVNAPSISFVYHIKTNPKKVNEGDLFIAKNKKDLDLAISNGAFGIVFDFDTPIVDCEIAWIRVKNIQDALVRLVRFKLSPLELTVYTCSDITYELLYIYKSLNKSIKFLGANLEGSVKLIENIKSNDILVSPNKALLDRIYPNNQVLASDDYKIKNLISHSLFETSFSYKGNYFSKLKIPSLYTKDFLNVFNFFNEEIEFSKLKKFSSFKPIFVDRFIDIVEFGKSDKFIVAQKNSALISQEIEYIKKHYRYAKTIYITNKYLENLNEEQLVITSLKELRDTLRTKRFNCAYIIGFELSKIKKILAKPYEPPTLL